MQDHKNLICDTHGPWLIVASYVVKSYSSASVGMMVWYLLVVTRELATTKILCLKLINKYRITFLLK